MRIASIMKLKLWLKLHKINKAGKAPISLRITIDGQRAEFSSDIRLFPDEWDQETETILPTRRKQVVVDKDNDFLEELKADARQAKKDLPKSARTASAVAAELRGTPVEVVADVCLLHSLDMVLESHYKHANQSTYQGFLRARNLVARWHGKPTLPRASFTKEKREQFFAWMLQTLSPAGVRSNRIALTAMWRRAKAYPDKPGPFAGIVLPKHKRVERASLSKEQLTTLSVGGPLPRLQHQARQVYMACFYLHGSRILAVLQLRWQDYDGTRIHYQAMKGGPKKAVVVSSSLALLLSQQQPGKPTDFIFPYLPTNYFEMTPPDRYKAQKCAVMRVNFHLREACKSLGLPLNIHPHTARHTMARMTFEATKDMRAAQHVLGHTNVRQTEAYVRSMLTQEIDDAASQVYDSLNF